jgi:multicomponent Na+:H+ antiporter subunit D
MVAPTAALVGLGVALSVLAGPLYRVSTDAAADLLVREPYVRAVFPEGAP